MRKFEVRTVLAGAYRGKDIEERECLLHLYEVTGGKWGSPKTLCGLIKEDNLCDVAEDGDPTCPVCAKRAAKLTFETLR